MPVDDFVYILSLNVYRMKVQAFTVDINYNFTSVYIYMSCIGLRLFRSNTSEISIVHACLLFSQLFAFKAVYLNTYEYVSDIMACHHYTHQIFKACVWS